MFRLEYLDILNQLKLNSMSTHFDEIVTDGIKCKSSTLDILYRLLTIEQTKKISVFIKLNVLITKF